MDGTNRRSSRIKELKLKNERSKDLENTKLFFKKQFGTGFIGYSTDLDFPIREIWELVPSNDKAYQRFYFQDTTSAEIIREIKSLIIKEFKDSSSCFVEKQNSINYVFPEIKFDVFLSKIADYYKNKNYYFYDLFIDSLSKKFIVIWEDQESKYVEIYIGEINTKVNLLRNISSE